MSNKQPNAQKQITNSVNMFAYGDAWGYVTEFVSFDKLKKNPVPPPRNLIVSDDTQMSIYTMKAIAAMTNNGTVLDELDFNDVTIQNNVRSSFARAYLMFYFDKDNNRAPGNTCMSALEKYHYSKQLTGREGSLGNDSLGCGTIMRTGWLGFLPYDRSTLANLAVLHSQVTHDDPVGWIVSAVLTLMMNDYAMAGNDEAVGDKDLFDELRGDKSLFDHAYRVVSELWAMNLDLLSYSEVSLDKVLRQVAVYRDHWDEIAGAIADMDEDSSLVPFVDVTVLFGEGWIADEALYNALAVVSLYRHDEDGLFKSLYRLVHTNGDSDSLAAIGGGLFAVAATDSVGIAWDHHGDVFSRFEERYQRELRGVQNYLLGQLS